MLREDFYRTIIQNAPAGFAYCRVIYDKYDKAEDIGFIEVNTAFVKLTGMDHAAVTGKRVTKLLPEIKSDRFNWIKHFGQLAKNNDTRYFEQFSEALQRWLRISAFSFETGYFAVQFYDITRETEERIDSARRIAESNTYNNARLEALPDLVRVLDDKGVFLDCKMRAAGGSTMPKQDFIGKDIADVFPEFIAQQVKIRIKDVLNWHTVLPFEYELPGSLGGGYFQCRLTAFGVDKVIAIVSNIDEITAFRQEQDRHLAIIDAILEASAEGIFAVNIDRQVIFYNKKFMEMWGLTPEFMIDCTEDKIRQYALTMVSNPQVLADEMRTNDGFDDSFEVITMPIVLKDGRIFERHIELQKVEQEVIGRVLTFRDVTNLCRDKCVGQVCAD